MKEREWGDCLTNQSAKTTTPDIHRAESLIELRGSNEEYLPSGSSVIRA